jgi:AcrR family transcriptional regulator
MASRETQQQILRTAIDLFNRSGTANVSTNKIADACGISRGHLHYHFSTKQEIIQEIFNLIISEMDKGWYDDHLTPTVSHMVYMFVRQLELIWRYRFFYRELVVLLRANATLRTRFLHNREKRISEVRRFLRELGGAGLFAVPDDIDDFEDLLLSSWVISDHWLNFFEASGEQISETAIRRGYSVFLSIVRPHLTPAGAAQLPPPRELKFDLK